MTQSPLPWLLLIIAGFFAWYTHDHWLPSLRGTIESAGEYVPEAVRPGWVDNTERIYKWKDAEGKWHVSNEPPKGVTDYQTERVAVDENIVPAPRKKKDSSSQRARKDNRR